MCGDIYLKILRLYYYKNQVETPTANNLSYLTYVR